MAEQAKTEWGKINKRKKEKRNLGDLFKSPHSNQKKPMYKEPQVELDEDGEEIASSKPSKKKYPAKTLQSIARYFMKQYSLQGNIIKYYKDIKMMIDLARDLHGDNFEKIEAEIKARNGY